MFRFYSRELKDDILSNY